MPEIRNIIYNELLRFIRTSSSTWTDEIDSPSFLAGFKTSIMEPNFLQLLHDCGIPNIFASHLCTEDIISWFAGNYKQPVPLLNIHIALLAKYFTSDFIIFDKQGNVEMYSLTGASVGKAPWIFERHNNLVIPVILSLVHKGCIRGFEFKPKNICNPWPLVPLSLLKGKR
jgi:hypothetical protein